MGDIRKIRLPVSRNEATCKITESASMTNTPPTKNSRISCLMMTATTPSEPPSANEPTSPINTSAGCALYQRRNHEVRMKPLEDGHEKLRQTRAVGPKKQHPRARPKTHHNLQEQLRSPGHAPAMPLCQLAVVVREPHRREAQHREQRDQHKRVGQVRPEQRWNSRRQHDQHSAHRRSPGLCLMPLRTLFADHLADLQLAEFPDHPWPEHQRQKQRRQARIRGAHRDVAEHVQRAEVFLQELIEEVVKHFSDAPPRRSPARLLLLQPARAVRAAPRQSAPSSLPANLSPAAGLPAGPTL